MFISLNSEIIKIDAHMQHLVYLYLTIISDISNAWVPRQLVAYIATFGTLFFSLKCCHLFTKFVMLKTNKWNEMQWNVIERFKTVLFFQSVFLSFLTSMI